MEQKTDQAPIALWNPTWAIIWSFIFTPIFGTFIQRRNWLEMGNAGKAKVSNAWFYVAVIFYVADMVLDPLLPEKYMPENIDLYFGVALYVAWIFADGLFQVREVKQLYGKNYYHKSLVKPIIIALFVLLLWMLVSVAYYVGLDAIGVISLDN